MEFKEDFLAVLSNSFLQYIPPLKMRDNFYVSGLGLFNIAGGGGGDVV